MLKRLVNRKGDGLAGIMIIIIGIVLVLACLPSLKALVNSNVGASNNLSQQIVNVTKP